LSTQLLVNQKDSELTMPDRPILISTRILNC
jgi:hypothetical protein